MKERLDEEYYSSCMLVAAKQGCNSETKIDIRRDHTAEDESNSKEEDHLLQNSEQRKRSKEGRK